MACIQPDGLLTRCGEFVLLAMWKPTPLESAAKECGAPLFRIRAAAREFLNAGLIEKNEDKYRVTEAGIAKMEDQTRLVLKTEASKKACPTHKNPQPTLRRREKPWSTRKNSVRK